MSMANNNSYTFVDNSDKVKDRFAKALIVALTKCGLLAERYAKQNITDVRAIDTGLLRNSITYALDGEEAAKRSYKASKGGKVGNYSGKAPKEPDGSGAVFIGTNVEYGPYVELGTGIHTAGGRQDPWVYKDDRGVWHRTNGMKARPFLKPAIADHTEEYNKIIREAMENG